MREAAKHFVGREGPMGSSRLSHPWLLPVAVAVYVLHALLALPLTGLQYDELIHLHSILPPERTFGTIRLGDAVLPSMILPYLGCLKTWLVWPWIEALPRSPETIRIPAILVGAAALWLTGLVLRRLAGPLVATVVMLLAAVDTTFVFCTTYDWGPAGLQLLLTGAVAWAAIRFHETGAARWAGLAALCAGLAVWNKALALWTLGALGIVVLVCVPAFLRRSMRWKPLAAALLCFAFGAFPFLAWNKKTGLATFRENQGISLSGIPAKAASAWTAFDGSQFLGYMVRGEEQCTQGPSTRDLPWLRALRQGGWRLGNGISFALVLSLLAGPILLRGDRLRLWLGALLALALALFQMMIVNGAGTGMHHYVLLFPLPFLLIALPLEALAYRGGKARNVAFGLALVLVAGSAFALHSHFAALRAWGPTPIWSTAIYDLVSTLRREGVRNAYALEWGTDSQLRFLLPPDASGAYGYEYLDTPTMPEGFRQWHLTRLRSPGSLFVHFAPPNQIQPQLPEAFRAFASKEGFRDHAVAEVTDAWGVPVYRVLRYLPAAP